MAASLYLRPFDMLRSLRHVFSFSRARGSDLASYEADDGDDDGGFHLKQLVKSPSRCILSILTFAVPLCVCSFSIGMLADRMWMKDTGCLRRLSANSAVLETMDIKLSRVRFNGSFFQETIFRQGASPEVDAAWEGLGVDYRPSIIREVYAEISGVSGRHVRVSSQYGGGFLANVEGLHNLHCLNLLRQSLFFNYEYYREKQVGAFKNEEKILQTHITHCVDTLRQHLMCAPDVGLLGQIWWDKEFPQAFPDFNTEHLCRNFEDIRRWAQESQAPASVPDDYLQSPAYEDVLEAIP